MTKHFSRKHLQANSYYEKIYKLENDLYMARRTIINLMSEDIQNILMSYHSCSTYEDSWKWADITADKIIRLAETKPATEMSEYCSSTPRALCPLCKESSLNPFGTKGFAIPEGLRRHLLGHNNSHECQVFGTARALARAYLNEKYPRA